MTHSGIRATAWPRELRNSPQAKGRRTRNRRGAKALPSSPFAISLMEASNA